MLTVSWIPLAGTGRMISTGETSGQIWETYGTSSPVNKRGQSKSALASLAEANENVTSNWYSEGTWLKTAAWYVDHIRGVRRESSVTCLIDQEGMRFCSAEKTGFDLRVGDKESARISSMSRKEKELCWGLLLAPRPTEILSWRQTTRQTGGGGGGGGWKPTVRRRERGDLWDCRWCW